MLNVLVFPGARATSWRALWPRMGVLEAWAVHQVGPLGAALAGQLGGYQPGCCGDSNGFVMGLPYVRVGAASPPGGVRLRWVDVRLSWRVRLRLRWDRPRAEWSARG